MNTVFPYQGRIDYDKYLDAYLRKKDAIRRIPSENELLELARKAIVRGHLVLTPLPAGEPAQTGDTAVLKTVSELPRFNKEKVTVTLGRGLYNRELENELIGKRAGESVHLAIDGKSMTATVLSLSRKQAPEPTDDMVLELQARDMQGNPLTTVAAYEAYIREEKTMETLATVNYYVMEQILADYPMQDYSEKDIKALGALERVFFADVLRKEGFDPEKEVPPDWEKDMNVHSLDDFIAMRREWYQMKIQQCLIYLNILGLPCEGKTDPLDHYEVLSELQLKMFEKIRSTLEGRQSV